MSQYTIIEDCSPYYIRFTFDGLLEVIEYIKSLTVLSYNDRGSYSHDTFSEIDGISIIRKLPMFKDFDWLYDRVSIFKTPPGGRSAIHKDGLKTEVGINIPLTILDNKCITSWYADKLFRYSTEQGMPYTRAVSDDNFDYPSLHEMIAQPNEMILFNVGIYHSWHNNSNNFREVLTLRFNDEIRKNVMTFDNAKRILFNNKE